MHTFEVDDSEQLRRKSVDPAVIKAPKRLSKEERLERAAVKHKAKTIEKAASNTPPSKSQQQTTSPQDCAQAVGSIHNNVAMGTVYPTLGLNETIHTAPLGEANVRVSISLAIKGDALLPIPIRDEYTTVDSAVGVPLAWPKELVITGVEFMKLNNVALDGDREKEINDNADLDMNDNVGGGINEETFKDFADDVQAMDAMEHILPLDKGVFERDVGCHMVKDDVLDVCRFEMLTSGSIIAYIRYLYETYASSRKRFGFSYPVDPDQFQDANPKSAMYSVVAERLKYRQGDQVILFPYYIPSAFIRYGSDNGTRPLNMDWKIVKCPRQSGGFECGYYVLRFMKHFVEDCTKSIKTKIRELEVKGSFSTSELAETRFELINYMIPFLSLKLDARPR